MRRSWPTASRTVQEEHEILVAEEIPAGQYTFRATEATRTVAEVLSHIVAGARSPRGLLQPEQRLASVSSASTSSA